ncbi:MAG: nickel pincer cofactor biosynthesis protein LarC [Lachnospiraceae bacterium]|nr:nickel pincer cofactor biosynthesis protein LarC [Lachnospiraceae bacterium]MDY4427491.1 nickel pincer cofactor biosynthesis protein LarC [Lachnospiraceae bacterium]
MKILYLDCGMGAAGDMLAGALVSLLSKEEQESFIKMINNIGVDGVKVSLSDDAKCGIVGKHFKVEIDGVEEHSHDVHEHEHHHEHEQEHGHHHEHHHHGKGPFPKELEAVAEKFNNILADDVAIVGQSDIKGVYELLAEAEAKVHGKDVSEIHFHEVGMKDALIDIASVVYLMNKLKVDKVVVSPVNVGFGKVKCAHGILPVPAPATAELVKGIPTYAGRFEGELLTPTGAALLKYYADEFSYQPLMNVIKCGYGTGNKNFESANVVKAVLGEVTDELISENVIELNCNVDDMSAEDMAYAAKVLIENGAKDAFVTPVIMKKGRSGMLLTVLCSAIDKERFVSLIFKHTSTIGIRVKETERIILNRHEETVHTKLGDVRVKYSEGYGVKREKPEFEDLRKLAEENNISVAEARKIFYDIYKA